MSTGLFHPTLLHILQRKVSANTANPGGTHTKKHSYTANHAQCELFSSPVCVSLCVVYFFLLLLLTRGMDVETNPGPGENQCATFMEKTHEEYIERSCSHILY